MDNAGTSLFQGTEINLSNAKQNDEDEEDLEEQRRRNEELQNLLTAKLDDFNFDESTINSSTNISAVSTDDLQNKYYDITNPHEQMKVLYDVRLREINSLREEYDNYKKEKIREIDQLKNKMFMYEAEVQQLKITLKNSEELLVEKSSCISEMKKSLNNQDELIKEYEKSIKNLHIDINSYQSTISELQLKLEAEKNPFHIGKKQFNSEELRKAHQEQIDKLQALLEEKSKTTSIMEKENLSLQDQIRKYIDIKNEDNTIITVLTKNFESAQQQCHELIEIIEKLTNENYHLRDRANEKYVESTFEDTHNQSNSGVIEKLKKMLLDKSVQNETLETKLRGYENSMKELLEYRQLKSDIYKKEFQQCENKDHIKSLLIMQNDIQNYKRLIEDKNQQILSLDSTNKELLAKLEDMLSQTRNDIQNFSHKYNLPQLEKMTDDLKKSQEKIEKLELDLKESEEKRNSLQLKLQKASKSPQKEVEMRVNELQQQSEKDRINFENNIKKLNKELEVAENENSNLKAYIDQLIDENAKLKLNIKNFRLQTETNSEKLNKSDDIEGSLKKQYLEAIQRFHESQNRIKNLEDNIQDLMNGKILAEGEHCNLRYQVNDYKNKLDQQNEIIKDLEDEVMSLNVTLKEKNDLINELRKNPTLEDYEELKMKFSNCEQALQSLEENNNQLVQQIENLMYELDQSREEIIKLTKELATETEKNVQRSLEKELNNTQQYGTVNPQGRNSEGTDVDILRIELRLREEIHNDYLQKLEEIEKKYKSSTVNKELYKEHANKFKIQENKYREQLSIVLAECAQKINDLEEDRQELLKKLSQAEENFNNYKQHVAASEKAYRSVIKDYQKEIQKNSAQWENWSKKYVNDCLEIETMYKKKQETILNRLSTFDKEVAAVEKTYNDKIKKYVKNCKI